MSGFCGKVVCKDCADKKRKNPKNNEEWLKICKMCNNEYLSKNK